MRLGYIAGRISGLSASELNSMIELAAHVDGWMLERGICATNPYGSCMCDDNFNIDQALWRRKGSAMVTAINAASERICAGTPIIMLLPGWEKSVGVVRYELKLAIEYNWEIQIWDTTSSLAAND